MHVTEKLGSDRNTAFATVIGATYHRPMKHLCTVLFTTALVAHTVLPALHAADSAALNLARQLNQAFVEVAEKVAPSVVVISVAHRPEFAKTQQQQNPLFEFLPKQFRDQMEEEMKRKKAAPQPPQRRNPVFDGQGSGIVVREDGYILTNRHVVEGADKIKVAFVDGKEYDAELRGIDTQSDIAVIKIKASGLKPAKFADSDKVKVGEFAIAVGTPFRLDYTVTIGHVSAKGRNRIIQDPAMQDQDFIQTDAPINPGNSGGPLVNIEGEVIGINTLIRGLGTGIGFAIPSSFAKDIGLRIIADGKVVRPWLGVAIQGLSENPDYRSLVRGVSDGVVVKEIDPSGPAAKADLKPFDVITAVDGKPVASSQQLRNQVRARGIGNDVMLDINRNGKNIKVKIKPEAWPDGNEVVSKTTPPPAKKGETPPPTTKKTESQPASVNVSKGLGLTVENITPTLAEKFKLKTTAGVVVTAISPKSSAETRGVKVGDLITEVNQKKVANVNEFNDAFAGANLKKGVVLNLVQKGDSKTEVLREGGE